MNSLVYIGAHSTLLNVGLSKYNDWGLQQSLLNTGFLGALYLPSSIMWIKMMQKAKEKIFINLTPYQLKHFSLMYFASKEALVFDLVCNHALYQGLFAIGYLTFLKKITNKEYPNDLFGQAIKLRVQLSAFSILFDIWLPQSNLIGKNLVNDPRTFDTKVLKIQGFKHMMITLIWHFGLARLYLKE